MAPAPPTALEELLTSHPHTFLQPSQSLHESLLNAAKGYLDPLANNVTDFQLARQKAEQQKSRKRKRSRHGPQDREELLRMKQVHVQGFDLDQVWAQARRVLDHTSKEVELHMPEADSEEEEGNDGIVEEEEDEDVLDDDHELVDESADEEDFDFASGDEDVADSDLDGDPNGFLLDDRSSEEGSEDLRDETPPSEVEDKNQPGESLVKDKFGLNDGFFSIDQFNKQTQFLEQQDANGDPDDGRASDEEDVDWEIDPFAIDPRVGQSDQTRRKTKQNKDDQDSEDDDEEGPTFGDVDLNAPEGESEDEDMYEQGLEDADGMDDFSNTNNIMYSDFFAPPAREKKKNNKLEKKDFHLQDRGIKNQNGEVDDDIQRTMSAVHRDLFEDDLSADEEEAEEDGMEGGKNLSSHERSQLALRKEIRRLEAENVANKHWSLTGETAAKTRPENALLEEDLDFERAGKPVPIITSEVNESLESLIKRRILSKEFDEIVRRRPTDLVPGGQAAAKRGRLEEVSDAKSKVGLAEEYEADYLKQNDPNYMDSRSTALKAKHQEIQAQWASVSAQLDALSNWHYKPKPAVASMDVRVDVPTIAMEDARPSVNGIGAGESALAPQDVYKPGDEKGKRGAGEVITKGGTAVAREEETRETKKRRRRREKERLRKSLSNNERKTNSTKPTSNGKTGTNKSSDNQEVAGQLRKGGVKVIGRKGEITDVAGKAVKDHTNANASSFKL